MIEHLVLHIVEATKVFAADLRLHHIDRVYNFLRLLLFGVEFHVPGGGCKILDSS